MPQKLIIFAHGIGDSEAGFEADWRDAISEEVELDNVTIKGLLWEDLLQKAADQYDFGSGALGEILEICNFPQLKKWTENASWKQFKTYMMDVLVYVGVLDMWLLIQDRCLLKLDELRIGDDGKEIALKDTILVGHSLGAAMLPHLVWREYIKTGAIPYRGMILMASPLGFESPNPKFCKDFLQRMAEMAELPDDRLQVLSRFSKAWRKGGKDRLKFINNENDIVCSDVKYSIPGSTQVVDLIPLRQGFDPNEVNALHQQNDSCVEWISFGQRDPRKIAENHDVLTYLRQDAFTHALNGML